MTTTFSPQHLVPDGRAMLSCTCLIPDGWMRLPAPNEEIDLDNPAVFLPLLVCMAPYGAVVFTIAARPSYGDGSVQEWAEYLAAQNNLTIEFVGEARVNRLPCIVVEGTLQEEVGVMRSRSVFLEDGQRLFNIGALAPDAIWASVRSDFDRLLGAFALDEVHGFTAPILREMTSAPATDLTAISEALARAGTPDTPEPHHSAQAADDAGLPPDASDAANSRPAQAADVALADDTATLDPEHVINARLRDSGAGLVPRVLDVVNHEKFAVVGAAALESTFRVPFGWHVIDDGRRTLVFDVAGGVQINLSQRSSPDGVYVVLESIGDDLAAENPQAQFLKLELLGCPCLAVRDLLIDGEPLDQAYLARPSHREQCALVCRVTATRAEMTRAMNTAEVIWMSLHGPAADTDG